MLISVFVSSPDTHSERRLESAQTVQQLKVARCCASHEGSQLTMQDKLTPITGISPQHQILRLYRSSESREVLASLDDETRSLDSYGVAEFNCIKVCTQRRILFSNCTLIDQVDNSDPNARPGEWNDVTGVEKFELSKEEYEARNGEAPPSCGKSDN